MVHFESASQAKNNNSAKMIFAAKTQKQIVAWYWIYGMLQCPSETYKDTEHNQ